MRPRALTVSFLVLTLVACTNTRAPSGGDASSSTDTMMYNTSSSSTAATVWDGKTLSGKHAVVLQTSKGSVTVELDADTAPKTVTNFITLSKSGYYDGLTFHRVIPGFMIQGGDPSGNGSGGASIYGETFEDEINSAEEPYVTGYKAGVMAMANRGPNTNGSQFFIMDADYPLPPLYTIFGRVTKGQSIVNAIAKVVRDQPGDLDRPKEPVTFNVKVEN